MNWTPETIQQLIDDRGWTQKQLAKELGTSLRIVQAWLAGDHKPGRQSARGLDRVAAKIHEPDEAGEPPPADITLAGATRLQLLTELLRREADLAGTEPVDTAKFDTSELPAKVKWKTGNGLPEGKNPGDAEPLQGGRDVR